MTRPQTPAEALRLALEGPSPAEAPDQLASLAMRLRAIGAQIQAPESLRARRGALLALDTEPAPPIRFVGGWRRGRAVLIAALLTLLTVVGAAAATLADRWLEATGDEKRAVPFIVPAPEESEDERTDGSGTDQSPVLEGLSDDGRDDEHVGDGEDAEEPGNADDDRTDDEHDRDGEDADEPEDANDDEHDGDGEDAEEPENANDDEHDSDGDYEDSGLEDATESDDDDHPSPAAEGGDDAEGVEDESD